jgi:hypothetical protein
VIFLMKKLLIFVIVIIVFMAVLIPTIADPVEVALDQQVELGVPGTFSLVDADQDRKAEAIKFQLEIKAYREGDFVISGNLEGRKNGHWVALATTVVPFQWSPKNNVLELEFTASNIVKYKISGPYRVILSLKDGSFELPAQIAGFSPKLAWRNFSGAAVITSGEINTMTKAKTAAETWARLQSLEPGNLTGITYNYDRWQLDYRKRPGEIMRFLVSPEGKVELMQIKTPGS